MKKKAKLISVLSAFGVLTIATAFGATSPLYIAIPCVAVSAILLLKIGNNSKIKNITTW